MWIGISGGGGGDFVNQRVFMIGGTATITRHRDGDLAICQIDGF